MREYKPPGKKCMLAIEKLEQLGPMGTREVAKLVPGASSNTLSQSLLRAVDQGLLTVKLGNQRFDNCNLYSVAQDWRDVYAARLDLYKQQPRKDRPQARTVWSNVSSVFQMGARA